MKQEKVSSYTKCMRFVYPLNDNKSNELIDCTWVLEFKVLMFSIAQSSDFFYFYILYSGVIRLKTQQQVTVRAEIKY